jgi:hypothetical protein
MGLVLPVLHFKLVASADTLHVSSAAEHTMSLRGFI